MNWTTTAPIREGFYWLRVGGGNGRTYPGVATARGFFDPAAT